MQFNKILFIAVFLLSSFSFGQMKGKAKHLPGTWVYSQGSGFEVWEMKDGALEGAGYRTSKIGDTIRVENLSIKEVNGSLFYTLETGTQNNNGQLFYKKHQFMSKRRKLEFSNIENAWPTKLSYSFGLFNKNKLMIKIEMAENVKPSKLILRKQL